MASKKKAVNPTGKQHDVRAASFLRMAEEAEKRACGYTGEVATTLREIAGVLKDEAGILRGMR